MEKVKWNYDGQEWSVNVCTGEEEEIVSLLRSVKTVTDVRIEKNDVTNEQMYLFVNVSFEQRRSCTRYSYVAPTMTSIKPWSKVLVEVLNPDMTISKKEAYAVSCEMKTVSELREIAKPFRGKLRKVTEIVKER